MYRFCILLLLLASCALAQTPGAWISNTPYMASGTDRLIQEPSS